MTNKRFGETMVQGFRMVYHNSKFVWLLWSANAAFALILTMPVYYLLVNQLSNSLVSDSLARGFDYFWFIQFMNIFESNISQLPYTIFSVVGIYTLIQTFFLAGLMSVFNMPKKNHFVDFFYGGVKHWFRFTKVLLLSLVFYAGAFLLNDLLGNLITLIFDSVENVLWDAVLRSLRYVILIFLIGVVSLISDYTKASMVVEDNIKAFYEIGRSLKFIKEHFLVVFVVFLTIAVIGAAGVVSYNIFDRFIPRTPFYFLFISFILQQSLIIFRLFIRMYFASTEVILYKDLSAEVIKVETE